MVDNGQLIDPCPGLRSVMHSKSGLAVVVRLQRDVGRKRAPMVRRILVAATALALAAAMMVPGGDLGRARAADLKISFAELTRLLQSIAASTRIYLNNAPGGLFTNQSFIQVGTTQQYPVPIPAKSFDILGSRYGYFVTDVGSTTVRLTPINGALRVIVNFESEGAEATALCISGTCRLADILPDIQWDNAVANIDFVPVRLNGSIAFEVKAVTIGGAPRAVCKGTADFLERQACSLGLPFANRSISQLKAELPKLLRDAANQPGIQQQLADGLKRYLTLGPAGEIAINNISIDPNTLTVSFKFNGAGN